MTEEYFTSKENFDNTKSQIRVTIQSAFYGNNVVEIKTRSEAYELARKSAGTVELTGMPVFKPVEQGLPKDANMLLFNDGNVYGRAAAARVILGEPNADPDKYATIIREAIYKTRYKKMYHYTAFVGLEEDFMIKAHLLIPETYENVGYNWMLNFQEITKEYIKMYEKSRKLPEGDIFIFSDPDWSDDEHKMGLSFFDPVHNCASLLGLRYFGEHKKGTLTLGWGAAARNNYASCHGGLKRYNISDKEKFTVAVFGLSGSGKSTITHAVHNNKYQITVLHDDAFIINVDKKYSIALEPTYFDKTADYPMGCPDNKFIITLQNNGVIPDTNGKLIAVTSDVRNGNGRAIKSKFWSPNRVDRIDEPINAIFWLMKDATIPPVLKLTGASLGSAFGATLATKRTSAERLAPGVDPNALVVEPYANPFRTYPLSVDYEKFKQLINDGVDCYILNTGDFRGKKVKPQDTLGIIEAIIAKTAKFKQWEKFSDIEIIDIDGFDTSLSDKTYNNEFKERIKDRIRFVKDRETFKGGVDKLPEDCLKALEIVLSQVE